MLLNKSNFLILFTGCCHVHVWYLDWGNIFSLREYFQSDFLSPFCSLLRGILQVCLSWMKVVTSAGIDFNSVPITHGFVKVCPYKVTRDLWDFPLAHSISRDGNVKLCGLWLNRQGVLLVRNVRRFIKLHILVNWMLGTNWYANKTCLCVYLWNLWN